ncbi:hypothetical protein GF337_03845 [candidate division KSB1 bacterium]|nr:hypothetical protein [candidate division KSB1 bacterium]
MNIKRISRYTIAVLLILIPAAAFAELPHSGVSVDSPEDLRLALKYPVVAKINIASQVPESMPSPMMQQTSDDPRFKAKGKAFLYSLLLPGAGEYYVGNKTMAKAFFFTELFLWAGFFSFDSYSNWKRDDMYVYAATHAGAQAQDKPAQYFVDIGNYDNIHEYNDAKQRQREFYKVYSEEEYYWSWDSPEKREEFEQMRISSDRAHNRAIFAIGGIIANHLVSAIDAVWQSYRYNKRLEKEQEQQSMRLRFDAHPAGYYSLTLEKRF